VTTRSSRAVSRSPLSPTRALTLPGSHVLFLATLLVPFAFDTGARAQEAQPAPSEPGQNEVQVAPHWSRYQAPTSYPEGTQLHIIQRGDTLWDLSNRYLQNPFLWPQLWDANRYIDNPHLIYPGDPVRIPEVEVVRPEGVEGGPGGPGGPGGEGGPGGGPEGEAGIGGPGGGPGGGPSGPRFLPAYEEVTIQCAGYLKEDANDDFKIFGSEEGDHKVGLATGDVVYLNRGSNDGVSPGDTYYTQRKVPFNWGFDDTYVRRSGWLRILAVQEKTSMAVISQACLDVYVGDYLKPFEPVPVPLLPAQPSADRMTPESGRMRGKIVASLDDLGTLGQGYLVSIDLGQKDGVVPGNVFTIYRYVYDNAPRKVLGELAILTVQKNNATARIMTSLDYIDVGDLVELK
jgi:LysM domain